jgi:hypothetical protein
MRRDEIFFASPGDPNGEIPAKVKLHQREIMFGILIVAAVRCPMPLDIDAALAELNAAEGTHPDTNHLIAEELKKCLANVKDQIREAQESPALAH